MDRGSWQGSSGVHGLTESHTTQEPKCGPAQMDLEDTVLSIIGQRKTNNVPMELLLWKQRFKWYVIAAASQEIAPTDARLSILHSINWK